MNGYIILIFIIFSFLFYILVSYNSIIASKHRVSQARSTIDIYLNQRFDLIPNLVECVKEYEKHEQKIFEETINLRNSYLDSKKLNKAYLLNSKCNSILAIAENYPDLKASTNFLHLQKSLIKMESQLQAARRLYNSEVTNYNTKLNTIPTNLIAKIFNFQEENLFQIEEYKKENINIDI